MKSTIRIDVDLNDKPVIQIKCVHTSDDLRDKSLTSLLRKLGFTHAHFGQKATLEIEYSGWGGGEGGDCYEHFTLSPITDSAKCFDELGKEIDIKLHASNITSNY